MGLIAALIVIAMMGGLAALGGGAGGMWGKLDNRRRTPDLSVERAQAAPRAVDDQLHLLPGASRLLARQSVQRQKPVQLEIAVGHPARQRLHRVARPDRHDIDDPRPDRRGFRGLIRRSELTIGANGRSR